MKKMEALQRWLMNSADPASEAETWAGLDESEKEVLAPLRSWRLNELEQRRQIEDKATRFDTCAEFFGLGFWTLFLDKQDPLNPEAALACSPSSLRLLGFQNGDDIPSTFGSWLDRVHPDDKEATISELLRYIRSDAASHDIFTLEIRLRHKNDSWRWLQAQGKTLEHPGQPLRLPGVVKDIAEGRQTRQSLAEQMAFQSELLKTLPIPVFIKDASTRFVSVNHAYEKAFGIRAETFVGKTVMDLPSLTPTERVQQQERDSWLVVHGGSMHREMDISFADGATHHCLYWGSAFQNAKREVHGIIGIIVDISEQKKTENELTLKIRELNLAKARIENISRTDHLTGLANRRAFMDRFHEAVSLAGRHGQPLSLLMADLDHFKQVNDTLGHDAGDRVLQDFATLLRRECRKEDLPARSGGEEFLVLLPMTNLEEAQHVADRICTATRGISTRSGAVTVSVGAVQYQPGEAPDALLKRVDNALYQAKENGRDQTCTAYSL